MSIEQPSKRQVLTALGWNGVHVTDVAGFRLGDDGLLEVQLDADGGIVLSRADWSPSRMCTGGAECVGAHDCPRRSRCTE